VSEPLFSKVPIDELRPNPWNVNSVSPENEEKLIASIKRLGLYEPIKVRQVSDYSGYEILGGEHRWRVAKRLGYFEIMIANLGFISDQTAKEITLADNSRYGTDDVVELARLLEEMGSADELSEFLPYTDHDFKAIFSSVDISLDDLEVDETDEKAAEEEAPTPLTAPRTHTVMRFKIPIGDAEKITELIAKIQKKFGFTTSDDMTNAGDALVHLLLSQEEAE
jgi:ParB-like chromosome segregation protein Spo0J